jgi:hypothetical protein
VKPASCKTVQNGCFGSRCRGRRRQLDAGLIPQKITASPVTSTPGSYPFTPTVPAEVQWAKVFDWRPLIDESHGVTVELDDRRRHSAQAVCSPGPGPGPSFRTPKKIHVFTRPSARKRTLVFGVAL